MIPNPNILRKMREDMGISQYELAAALRLGPNGPKVIRDWETGERSGRPFTPTPLAWHAFRCLALLADLYFTGTLSVAHRKKLEAILPEAITGCTTPPMETSSKSSRAGKSI